MKAPYKPVDKTRAERGVTNRSSDFIVSEFSVCCVTIAFIVFLVVWF